MQVEIGRRVGVTVVALAALVMTSAPADANPESDALRRRGFRLAYNLDHDAAIATLIQAVAADPTDPSTYRSVASVTWLHILFQRGTVLVHDYLGGITKPNVSVEDPPLDLAEMFHEYADRALELAEQRVKDAPDDPDAHYELGATVGLMASYSATVEGELIGGLRAARRAYDEHERVLDLTPDRHDAKLILGTYRYVVSTLPFPVRMMAYLVGFGGGKEAGLAMIEEAVGASDTEVEAQFALILMYNREERYAEAQRILARLQDEYPKNRLLWLEAGATALRAERPPEAAAALAEGFAKLDGDPRPRMYGETSLWHYARGAAWVALGQVAAARRDLEAASTTDTHIWVRGRCALELGKIADLDGDRARARDLYAQAIRLCKDGRDKPCEKTAQRLRESPYRLEHAVSGDY